MVMVMTKLLEEAIATVRRLPDREQDVAAKLLFTFVNPEAAEYQLSDEQLADVEIAKREVRAGKIATEAAMADVWRRFGP
jgi:hypothetical protein